MTLRGLHTLRLRCALRPRSTLCALRIGHPLCTRRVRRPLCTRRVCCTLCKLRVRRTLSMLGGVGLALSSCLALSSRPAAAATFKVVTAAENTFSPADLTITLGDSVAFENVSQGFHNVDADDHSFRCANGCDSQGGDGSISSTDWSFTLTFNQPGTVGYFCDNHGFPGGGMHGTITVKAAGGPPAPPGAPSDLAATAVDTADILLTWTSNSTNESDFRIQSKTLDGSAFQDLLPLVPAGASRFTVSGLKPGTGYGFRIRAENSGGSSAYSNEADAATDVTPSPCSPDANTLCLGAGSRFKAVVGWATADGMSGRGTAVPLLSNPDSGLFYFFSASNIEMLVKVLNACVAPFNSYWVFFAATTNVQLTVTVIDTASGKTRVYFNPAGQAALPIQDTSAFATCP